MAPQLGATFVPGGFDDFSMPEVVAPSPQRVTPQVPQNMQDDLQRLELETREMERHDSPENDPKNDRPTSLFTTMQMQPHSYAGLDSTLQDPARGGQDGNIKAYNAAEGRAQRLDTTEGGGGRDPSPFPSAAGDNIPPADNAKEEILWSARKHVLHSQDVQMQLSWARDVLMWAEIAMDAVARESAGSSRPATPRIEHELRTDALKIVNYLADQEHPDALYIRSKWLEFGKFGRRVDKQEAYGGYRRAAELGNVRSEYRMGMLCEQSNDIHMAKEHYCKGLSLKDSAASYRMGMMSLLGQHGESKDYAIGLERIRVAADGADEDAPQGSYVFGMLLGRDLPDISVPDGLLNFDQETAKMYVEKAAYLGFAKAQLKMGQAYELCQLSCDFNPSYSLHYYRLAAKQGLPEAALGVSRWFLFGYEGVFKKNEELAFRYAKEAAASSLPTGEFAMGYYYEIGIHVSQSISDARRWYQLAADHGNKDAAGRLESLKLDQSLSKQDHETTTLTRIKSQHGSQRGRRPDRFKQPQHMPTLSEAAHDPSLPDGPSAANPSQALGKPSLANVPARISPHPSPGIKPTIVSDHTIFPDSSRVSLVEPERSSAFNLRLDGHSSPPVLSPPLRSHSAAPYPDDDQPPPPLNMGRPSSAAPYPDDDVRMPMGAPYGSSLQPLDGPQAPGRPSSAFGNQAQPGGSRWAPASHSTGNLHAPTQSGPPRGRVASAGWASQGAAGGYRQPSPGPRYTNQRPFAGDDSYDRPLGGHAHPGTGVVAHKPPQQPRPPYPSGPPSGYDAGRDHGYRSSSQPGAESPLQYDPRITPQKYERFSRVPGATGRSERVSSMPLQDAHRPPRAPTGPGQASQPQTWAGGRTGSNPPTSQGSTAPTPAKPPKGPATFEDMGIPQGKQDGDCIVM